MLRQILERLYAILFQRSTNDCVHSMKACLILNYSFVDEIAMPAHGFQTRFVDVELSILISEEKCIYSRYHPCPAGS